MPDQTHLYATMTARKRSGGERIINAPFWPTANIQKKLLGLLEELYRPSSRVMGFVKGRGIRENARFHVGKRLILNVDLENYFGSIHAGRIRRRLMARPYSLSDDVATTIAKLCTLNGFLPTGAATSPILANIVSSSLDGALTDFAKQHGCFYTRYADDITFSTNRKSFPQALVRRSEDTISGVEIGSELEDLIVQHGFKPQPKKTRLMNKSMRQEVCGVTCNARLNVRRSLFREVRGALNAWRKYGRAASEEIWKEKYNWRKSLDFERSLRGRIEHIIHIKGQHDSSVANLVSQFNSLPSRQFKDISYSFEDSDPIGILESVCLIFCADEDNLMWAQGSGFVIEGGAVVTNHHVVNYRQLDENDSPLKSADGQILPKKLFPVIRLQFEGQEIEYDMCVVYSDEKKDIAVLRPVESFFNSLFAARACKLSFSDTVAGQAVSIVGYPNHTTGGSCKIAPTHVSGFTPFEGQTYFTVSQIIVQGNSGGPVVDEYGQVVGIATKGVSPTEALNLTFNGCIPINSIDKTILTSC